MKITVEITQVPGGYTVDIPELNVKAVAGTPRQAANRVKELVQEALEKAEK